MHTAGVSPVEAEWLAYARRVCRDLQHRADCRSLGGSPVSDPLVAPDARWPGYLGQHYRPGDVLWVNIVHSDLAGGGAAAAAEVLVDANARWSSGKAEDEEYLRLTRKGYLDGFDHWKVGGDIRKVLGALGRSTTQFAYTNAARCQLVPAGKYEDTQDRLLFFCQGWLPLRGLVAALQPGLLFVTATRIAPMLNDLPGDPIVVVRTQRNGTRPYGWQPVDSKNWLTELTTAYRERTSA